MVESIDLRMGRILGALRDGGQLDNAVVLSLQDNGSAEGIGRGSRFSGFTVSRSLTPMKAETPQYRS
jgi:arylsulfatase A-like enzyme